MRITGAVCGRALPGPAQQSRSCAGLNMDREPIANKATNELRLTPGERIPLGTYAGEMVYATIDPRGGVSTTANPGFKGSTGQEVTAEQRLAAEQAARFTRQEHDAIGRQTGVIANLNMWSRGRTNEEGVNTRLKARGIDVGQELARLGIDPSRPFQVDALTVCLRDDGTLTRAGLLDTTC